MNIFQKITLKMLKENRSRTLVTIVGIILSAAMFTGVTTSISSLRYYLLQSTIYNSGDWHGAGFGLSAKEKEKAAGDARVTQSASMEFLGFANLTDYNNDSKPYLCVYGIQQDFTKIMPIHLLKGRLPQNDKEILLPEHLMTNGGVDWGMDDKLSLVLGSRIDSSGRTLTNQDAWRNGSSMDSDGSNEDEGSQTTEQLIPGKAFHYTVVGIYERPSFESYDAPGYTALTMGPNSNAHSYDLYVKTNAGKNTTNVVDDIFDHSDADSWKLNYDLLRIYGYSGESNYNKVLFSLGAILIAIIMFGSISLIYNAFSISVSERTRQFGLLASIGATKRQLIFGVLFESLFLSVIGIPLGLLSGIAGIGVTFFFVHDMMANMFGFSFGSYQMMRLTMIFGPAKNVSLKLHPSLGALAAAVIISLATVIISAYIPARRAMKRSAIEAIRLTDDISIRPRKVKTSPLTGKLFGFEGMIAAKNFKRNRKKYRATVISLFLSIVLFISASSLCAYMTRSVGTVLNENTFGIAYRLYSQADLSPDQLLAELSKTTGVTASTYAARLYLSCSADTQSLSGKLRDYRKKEAEQYEEEYQEYDDSELSILITFLADDDFCTYLQEQKLPKEDYFDPSAPKAVAADSLRLYVDQEKKYYRFSAFSNRPPAKLDLYLARQIDHYRYAGRQRDDNGVLMCNYYKDDSEEKLTLPQKESCLHIPLAIGAVTEKSPDFFPDDYECVQLFYPYCMIDSVFSSLEENTDYCEITMAPLSENMEAELLFQCEDHKAAAASMTNLLAAKNLPSSSLIDYASSAESERAMITVINIFSYGFITLISLIAAANVFNTISTNIKLRRREFAMLRSIGMTPGAFSKMMNFECLLYGFKGLLYGLPVSFFTTYLIYQSVSQGMDMAFFVPWYSIAIAIGSVFLVVFATMVYSMRRIRKENILETLKNENL